MYLKKTIICALLFCSPMAMATDQNWVTNNDVIKKTLQSTPFQQKLRENNLLAAEITSGRIVSRTLFGVWQLEFFMESTTDDRVCTVRAIVYVDSRRNHEFKKTGKTTIECH